MVQTIFIGADHAGYEMKEKLIPFIKGFKVEVIDVGTHSSDSVDYPDFAFKVGEAVVINKDSLGILICGTGFGMCFAANKVKGIRAVDVVKPDMAPLARQHNNANILCLSARFVTYEDNAKIINAFMNATYEERHQKRIDKVTNYEAKYD
ncbi:MAG: ribose 5-phosphate isomerase B [Mycoplasmataceae bacterium]|jgi:ribose 5-phosphate isomerase B|nr:ribose 5-phosphate isomerase B [Mycoplasmataceae bacterium]